MGLFKKEPKEDILTPKVAVPICADCGEEMEPDNDGEISRCKRCEKTVCYPCLQNGLCKKCYKYYEEERVMRLEVTFSNSIVNFETKGKLEWEHYKSHGNVSFNTADGSEILIPYDNVLYFKLAKGK